MALRLPTTIAVLCALVALLSFRASAQNPPGNVQPPSERSASQSSGSQKDLASAVLLPAIAYDSGGYEASAVAVADMNADGFQDLIVANSYACAYPICMNGSVGVLLGNGDGTFQSPMAYSSGAPQTISVAVGDVNGDGAMDVVTVSVYHSDSRLTGSVSVLLGNGDGTLQAAAVYDSGAYGARSVAVGDVNGDAKVDVIVANTTGGLGALLGNGDGTFQPVVIVGLGPEYGNSVAIADVNGDLKPDLLTGSTCVSAPYNCTDLVGVLLGNGDGTFQTVAVYDSGEPYESAVAVADVNGDGKPDLLTANLDANTVGVLFGRGDGTFRSVVTYPVAGHYARAVDAGDVNGDGTPDLVVAIGFDPAGQNGSVGVLLGSGDGTFQPALTYGAGGVQTSFSIKAVDLNGDRRADVVTSVCAVDQLCGSVVNGAAGVLLASPSFCTTSPAITLSTTPTSLWPPNGQMVPVTISGTITDTGAGCSVKIASYFVTDEYGDIQSSGPVTFGPEGAYSFIAWLQASRRGSDRDGRRYTVNVQAVDDVGNVGSKTGVVTVPHDQRR